MTEASKPITELESLKGSVTYERLNESNGRFTATVDVSIWIRRITRTKSALLYSYIDPPSYQLTNKFKFNKADHRESSDSSI